MNVAVLQLFLHSLVPPLRAVGSGESAIAQLEDACQALEPFRDRLFGEFAEFLMRCHDYERQGHWPSRSPSITGELLDEPTPTQYADRLRKLLQREVTDGSLSSRAKDELKKLEKSLQLATLKQIAEQTGVSTPANKKPQVIDQIVGQLTGRTVTGKAKGTAKANIDDVAMRSLAEELRQRIGTPELSTELDKLQNQPLPALKALAKLLGVKGTPKSKPAALTAIRNQLEHGTSAPSGVNDVDQLAKMILALKSKAEVPGAHEAEIESELISIQQQMNKEIALAVCNQLGTG